MVSSYHRAPATVTAKGVMCISPESCYGGIPTLSELGDVMLSMGNIWGGMMNNWIKLDGLSLTFVAIIGVGECFNGVTPSRVRGIEMLLAR